LSRKDAVRYGNNGVNYLFGVWREKALSDCEGATFEKDRLRRLRFKSREMEPTIWIGKEGASAQLLQHVENQLKSRELVKLKLHKSALEKSETISIAENIAASTASKLIDVMGHTFTLYRKRKVARVSKER